MESLYARKRLVGDVRSDSVRGGDSSTHIGKAGREGKRVKDAVKGGGREGGAREPRQSAR